MIRIYSEDIVSLCTLCEYSSSGGIYIVIKVFDLFNITSQCHGRSVTLIFELVYDLNNTITVL